MKPNILIIHTDQQSCWTIGAYGGKLITTPHIDRLASEGARFDQFFTNSAVCTPSRGCFFTGRYPHDNGAYANSIPLNADEVTFAEVLRQNGYATGYAGKWHLDGSPRPGWVHPLRSMGFEDCKFMFNRGHWRKLEDIGNNISPAVYSKAIGDERTYTTDYLTDKTIDFLSKNHDRPFCYVVSIPDPHDPYAARPPYDKLVNPEDIPIPETFSQENLPEWAVSVRDKGPFSFNKPDREKVFRRLAAEYLGAVKLIDDSVGRIIATLEQHGILDDTIVIFTSDHGDYMGEHGLANKNLVYETAYRVPLLVRWPEKIPAGRNISRLMSTVDFQPTLLALAGVEKCGREQGKDASGLLLGKQIDWDDIAYFYHSNHAFAGAFTPEYELTLFSNSVPVLFDRLKDPLQVTNVYEQKKGEVKELESRLRNHMAQHPHPGYEWLYQQA